MRAQGSAWSEGDAWVEGSGHLDPDLDKESEVGKDGDSDRHVRLGHAADHLEQRLDERDTQLLVVDNDALQGVGGGTCDSVVRVGERLDEETAPLAVDDERRGN